jgi:BirA family biotin operon repressor/biotin-[acetyl-CoA-carboxylase] ligase
MGNNTKSIISELLEVDLVEYFDEIPSTNDYAMELLRAGFHGTAIIAAKNQTNGHGRRGAKWHTWSGSSAIFSYIHTFPKLPPPSHLAIVSGVVVANGVGKCLVEPEIKWPNDIIVNNNKVGGILVETHGTSVVIGVGVNITVENDDFQSVGLLNAGSLNEQSTVLYDTSSCSINIMMEVEYGMKKYEEVGINKFLVPWNKYNWLRNRNVRVTGPFGIAEGEGLFITGKLLFDVFTKTGIVAMPLGSKVEVL